MTKKFEATIEIDIDELAEDLDGVIGKKPINKALELPDNNTIINTLINKFIIFGDDSHYVTDIYFDDSIKEDICWQVDKKILENRKKKA